MNRHRIGKIFRKYFILILLLWILLVLYQNPVKLGIGLYRIFNPTIDPIAVESLSTAFPDDPVTIERMVLETVPYSYDWQANGMPWYFPTIKEVLANGKGDCKARAIVFASILENKDIPYTINMSFMHIWIDYEGKEETAYENTGVSFYEQDPETGQRSFRIPSIPFAEMLEVFAEGFWTFMPISRKVLLVSGLVILLLARILYFKETSRQQHGKSIESASYP